MCHFVQFLCYFFSFQYARDGSVNNNFIYSESLLLGSYLLLHSTNQQLSLSLSNLHGLSLVFIIAYIKLRNNSVYTAKACMFLRQNNTKPQETAIQTGCACDSLGNRCATRTGCYIFLQGIHYVYQLKCTLMPFTPKMSLILFKRQSTSTDLRRTNTNNLTKTLFLLTNH